MRLLAWTSAVGFILVFTIVSCGTGQRDTTDWAGISKALQKQKH